MVFAQAESYSLIEVAINVAIALVVTLSVLAIVVKMLQWFGYSGVSKSGGKTSQPFGPDLHVVKMLPITKRSYIAIVQIGSQHIAIGVTDSTISLLHTLDEEDVQDDSDETTTSAFADALQHAREVLANSKLARGKNLLFPKSLEPTNTPLGQPDLQGVSELFEQLQPNDDQDLFANQTAAANETANQTATANPTGNQTAAANKTSNANQDLFSDASTNQTDGHAQQGLKANGEVSFHQHSQGINEQRTSQETSSKQANSHIQQADDNTFESDPWGTEPTIQGTIPPPPQPGQQTTRLPRPTAPPAQQFVDEPASQPRAHGSEHAPSQNGQVASRSNHNGQSTESLEPTARSANEQQETKAFLEPWDLGPDADLAYPDTDFSQVRGRRALGRNRSTVEEPPTPPRKRYASLARKRPKLTSDPHSTDTFADVTSIRNKDVPDR